jgi:hypothetical protein
MKRKIALFFWCLACWTLVMSFVRIALGRELELGTIILFGTISAFVVALVKPRR